MARVRILMLVPAKMLPIIEESTSRSTDETSRHHALHRSPPVTDESVDVVHALARIRRRTDPAEREELRDDIDAIVAHLYGLSRSDFDHILGTFPLVFPDTEDGRAKRAALLEAFDWWGRTLLDWSLNQHSQNSSCPPSACAGG